MKKITLLILLGLFSLSFTFAQDTAMEKITAEKMSYALGVLIAENFTKDSLAVQYDQVYKGMKDIFGGKETEMSESEVMTYLKSNPKGNPNADMKKVSYGFGFAMAQNMLKGGLDDINMVRLEKATKDFTSGKALEMPVATAKTIVSTYQKEKADKQKELAMADGVQFLAENAKRKGIKVTPSGLQYKIIKPGSGIKPSAQDKVTVHYTGTLIDGTKFDSSVDRGTPATFGLQQVIRGWTEGVQLMPEGSKFRFYIPYDLAYGERGSPPNIPGFSALIFDIDLIKVVKAVPANSKQ